MKTEYNFVAAELVFISIIFITLYLGSSRFHPAMDYTLELVMITVTYAIMLGVLVMYLKRNTTEKLE
jgi:hypothetical protein